MEEVQEANREALPEDLANTYRFAQLTGPGLVDAPEDLQEYYLGLDAEGQIEFQAFQERLAKISVWHQKHVTPATIGSTFLGLTGITASLEYGVTPGRAALTAGAATVYYTFAKGIEKGVEKIEHFRTPRSMGVEVEG